MTTVPDSVAWPIGAVMTAVLVELGPGRGQHVRHGHLKREPRWHLDLPALQVVDHSLRERVEARRGPTTGLVDPPIQALYDSDVTDDQVSVVGRQTQQSRIDAP